MKKHETSESATRWRQPGALGATILSTSVDHDGLRRTCILERQVGILIIHRVNINNAFNNIESHTDQVQAKPGDQSDESWFLEGNAAPF